MSEFCIYNRPTTPGLYWLTLNLGKPISWAQAQQVHTGMIEDMAQKSLFLGAFVSKSDNRPLYGERFEAQVKSGRLVIGRDYDFAPAQAYPFGYSNSVSVTAIGYYAILEKSDAAPAGATLPIKTCFDSKGKLLYEEDSTGRKFRSVRPSVAPVEPNVLDPTLNRWSDIGLGYDDEYSDFDGFGDTVDADDYPYGYDSIALTSQGWYRPLAQHPDLVPAGAGTFTLLIGVVIGLIIALYVTNGSITVRDTGISPKNPLTKGVFDRILGFAKETFKTAFWGLIGIVAAPFIFRAILEMVETSQEKSYEGRG
jgi:hypothetical protein